MTDTMLIEQLHGELNNVMGDTYASNDNDEPDLSRLGVPKAKHLSRCDTHSSATPDANTRLFGTGVDLQNPSAMEEGQVDLPSYTVSEETSENVFPTPSLTREEVYEPPAFMPEVERPKSTSATITAIPKREKEVKPASAAVEPANAALYDFPSSRIQRDSTANSTNLY